MEVYYEMIAALLSNRSLLGREAGIRTYMECQTRRAFLESPETFRVDFGQDNLPCILSIKTFLSIQLS